MQIYTMKNSIKNYAWGSKTFLSKLMGQETHNATPQAELWMGTHPQGVSEIQKGDEWLSLDKFIFNHPDSALGNTIARQCDNNLPFLFKILAIGKPLSIQVHPDVHQAVSGYERENKHNIPLSASNRNFKDKSPKPELVCALTPLWAMCGFRSYEDIQKNFLPIRSNIDLCQPDQTIDDFFYQLLHLDNSHKNKLITAATRYAKSNKDQSHWQWVMRLSELFPDDIGVLAPLFLNTICLSPGEGLFLQPGLLHAYLDGNAIEIMCNSDNVIRGGLTTKHIDIETLLEIVSTQNVDIHPIQPKMVTPNEWHYSIPINNFSLTRYDILHNHCLKISVNGPEVLLCIKGNIRISQETGNLLLKPGMSAFVSYDAKCYTIDGDGVVYKASAIGENISIK